MLLFKYDSIINIYCKNIKHRFETIEIIAYIIFMNHICHCFSTLTIIIYDCIMTYIA